MFYNKNDKLNIIKIFLSMVVNYSSVEMTGNYITNIQKNITHLTFGTRVKNFSRRYFEIFFLFVLSFSGKENTEIIIKLSSAEFSQRL